MMDLENLNFGFIVNRTGSTAIEKIQIPNHRYLNFFA